MIAVDLLLLQMELKAIKPVSGELIVRACEDVHDFPSFSRRDVRWTKPGLVRRVDPGGTASGCPEKICWRSKPKRPSTSCGEADIYAEASQFRTYTFPIGAANVFLAQRFSRMIPGSLHFGFGGMAAEVLNARVRYCPRCFGATKRQSCAGVGCHPQTTAERHGTAVVTAWAASLLKQGTDAVLRSPYHP